MQCNFPLDTQYILLYFILLALSLGKGVMAMLKKNFTKTGSKCRVTFDLPGEVGAKRVALCGEFNEWKPKAHRMKQRKDGSFSITLSLPAGQSYRFKYLVDGKRWENDWSADAYVPNSFGSEDSLLEL
jgi:1,4-alpha-glucan branching enzyme